MVQDAQMASFRYASIAAQVGALALKLFTRLVARRASTGGPIESWNCLVCSTRSLDSRSGRGMGWDW